MTGTVDSRLPVAVVGTAGHIDHGKSALVRALTGVDPDRIPEEKRRGITIVLGYASLTLPGGRTVSVVDVPGHERFIKTMAAGAAVVDLCILAVDAGDGVKPQSIEHLHIMEALGVGRGVVALTKCDAVDADLRALATEEVRDLLAGTFLDDAPIVETSAVTGQGLDDLARVLDDMVGDFRSSAARQPLRMPVDRVFAMPGFGTVVTGTLLGGRIREADRVTVAPPGTSCRVRGIQVHGGPVDEAVAPTRVALNIAGVDEAGRIRGSWVHEPDVFRPSGSLLVTVRPMPWVRRPVKLPATTSMNHGSAAVECEVHGPVDGPRQGPIEPGATTVARIVTAEPVVARAGDRFILRVGGGIEEGYSTVAGGIVIDPLFRGRRLGPRLVEQALALDTADPAAWIAFGLAGAGVSGIDPAETTQRCPMAPAMAAKALARMLQRREAVKPSRRVVMSGRAWSRASEKADGILARWHEQRPERLGMKRDELRDRIAGPSAGAIFEALLARKLDEGRWKVRDDLVAMADHEPGGERVVAELAERIHARVRAAAAAPPGLKSLAGELDEKPERIRRAADLLVASGRARLLDGEFVFDAGFLDDLETRVREFFRESDRLLVTDLKTIAGVTRKHALPLARWLDDSGITVRRGDVRYAKS